LPVLLLLLLLLLQEIIWRLLWQALLLMLRMDGQMLSYWSSRRCSHALCLFVFRCFLKSIVLQATVITGEKAPGLSWHRRMDVVDKEKEEKEIDSSP